MHSATLLSPQTPAITSLLQLPVQVALAAAKQPTLPSAFGEQLVKLLPLPNQPAESAITPTAVPAMASATQTTVVPQQSAAAPQQQPDPAPQSDGAAPATELLPIALPVLALPDTAAPVRQPAVTTKANRAAAPARRASSAAAVVTSSAALTQQQPVPTNPPAQLPTSAAPALKPVLEPASPHGEAIHPAHDAQPVTTQPATSPVSAPKAAEADLPPIAAPVPAPLADAQVSAPPQPAAAAVTPISADAIAHVMPAPAEPASAPQPIPGTTTVTAPVSSPLAPSPATQIAPALVQMGHASDGSQRLTVRLDPPDLGHVQIRIDRPAEAPAHVEITVEKPETLTLLLRDQPQLQRALDQAGVPAEGRSVTFHVATPEASSRNEPATAPAPSVASGGLSGDGTHGAPRQGGQPTR